MLYVICNIYSFNIFVSYNQCEKNYWINLYSCSVISFLYFGSLFNIEYSCSVFSIYIPVQCSVFIFLFIVQYLYSCSAFRIYIHVQCSVFLFLFIVQYFYFSSLFNIYIPVQFSVFLFLFSVQYLYSCSLFNTCSISVLSLYI